MTPVMSRSLVVCSQVLVRPWRSTEAARFRRESCSLQDQDDACFHPAASFRLRCQRGLSRELLRRSFLEGLCRSFEAKSRSPKPHAPDMGLGGFGALRCLVKLPGSHDDEHPRTSGTFNLSTDIWQDLVSQCRALLGFRFSWVVDLCVPAPPDGETRGGSRLEAQGKSRQDFSCLELRCRTSGREASLPSFPRPNGF